MVCFFGRKTKCWKIDLINGGVKRNSLRMEDLSRLGEIPMFV
jgi:hypothetical protein